MLNQVLQRRGLTFLGRNIRGSRAVHVGLVERILELGQELKDAYVSLVGGQSASGLPVSGVQRVDAGAGLQQRPEGIEVAASRRQQERRVPGR